MALTKPESYQDRLKRLIKERGQYHTIYRTKFGVVEGYKKAEALVGTQPGPLDKVPRFTDIEVDTLEEHLRLCEILAPPRLKGPELKTYANKRAKEFLKLGVKPGRIVSLLADICHISTSYMSRILPDEFKDLSQQRTAEQSSPKLNRKAKLISKIREQHDWLTDEDIQEGLKHPEQFLNKSKQHYESLKVKPTVKADPSELIEVAYAKLEEEKFPKLDESTLRWIKFLYETYYKKDDLSG